MRVSRLGRSDDAAQRRTSSRRAIARLRSGCAQRQAQRAIRKAQEGSEGGLGDEASEGARQLRASRLTGCSARCRSAAANSRDTEGCRRTSRSSCGAVCKVRHGAHGAIVLRWISAHNPVSVAKTLGLTEHPSPRCRRILRRAGRSRPHRRRDARLRAAISRRYSGCA